MLEKVAAYIDKHQMIQNNDKVIVGISGGADSVCLLCVLRYYQAIKDIELVAVHVNHELRGDAARRDEQFVESLCEKWGVTCMVYHRNVKAVAAERKLSVEEAGREIRREVFAVVMDKCRGTKVALAHQMNDNAETLLFHLARGTGLKGAGGMDPVSGTLIRPLLCLERGEIEAYLEAKGISYCQDESNDSDEYTRNRIRHRFITGMEQDINPRAVFHMNRTMAWLRQVQEHLEQEVEYYWCQCTVITNGGWLLQTKEYKDVPEILKTFLIKKMIEETAGRKKDISAVHIEAVEGLLLNQVGRHLDLPYGIRAVRVYEGIYFTKEKSKKHVVTPIDLFAEKEIRVGNLFIRHEIIEAKTPEIKLREKPYTKYFDYDIIGKDVSIRTREPGDDIVINHAGNTQKLKSFFINNKIPESKRDEILLITSGHHVLWVVGYRSSCAYQVGNGTRQILKIEISKGTEDDDCGNS